MSQHYGPGAISINTAPLATETVEIQMDDAHPLLSGALMLGQTNDGFVGFNAVDLSKLDGPVTLELMALDAGTEVNNEIEDHLNTPEGVEREPEGGVVAPHKGIRGGADALDKWKLDPTRPMARITIEPAE